MKTVKSPRKAYFPLTLQTWPWRLMNKEEPSTVWSQGPQKLMQKSVDLWAQRQEVIMKIPPLLGQGIFTITTQKDSIIYKDPDCYESHIFHWTWVLMQATYGEALRNHCYEEEWRDLQTMMAANIWCARQDSLSQFSIVTSWGMYCYVILQIGALRWGSSNLVKVT